MDTETLLYTASERAAELSLSNGLDPEAFMEALGLTDHDKVRAFTAYHAREIAKVTLIIRGEFTVEDLMGMSMMFGVTVGYQMALLREETMKGETNEDS